MASLQLMKPLILLLCSVLFVLHAAAYTPLSDDTLQSIPAAGIDFNIHSGGLLAPILIPRVPGTPGIESVRAHFVNFFRSQVPSWNVEWQNSTSTTPATGDRQIPFRNLIVSRDPPWAQPGQTSRLTLVAHYDSKINPQGFIGATDSAAPCAMLMHAARSVDEALTKKWDAMAAEGAADLLDEFEGVQILFLDGEEAFETWTDSDSLYGARALASEWESSAYPALSTYHTPLSAISLFLLLDLLGAAEPRVPSFFKTTHWAYRALSDIETRSRALSILGSTIKKTNINPTGLFLGDTERVLFGSMVQDDHIPFMARGVEVLHIIPAPFPRVWHQLDDDGEHLDASTVEDWAMLVTAFIGEYMDLEGYFPTLAQAEARQESLRNGVHKRETRKTELLNSRCCVHKYRGCREFFKLFKAPEKNIENRLFYDR